MSNVIWELAVFSSKSHREASFVAGHNACDAAITLIPGVDPIKWTASEAYKSWSDYCEDNCIEPDENQFSVGWTTSFLG